MTRIFALFIFLFAATTVWAQNYPTVDPTATYTYTSSDGTTAEATDPSEPLSAPVVAVFKTNPADVGEYEARYEWKIWHGSMNTAPILHRFDEDVEYTFTQSGTYHIRMQATFILGNDTIVCPEEGESPINPITVAESKLEFPNAFSPNGDGYNDVYRAKDGWQSIVSFEATIYNRWGNKIYSWNDLSGGWDGRWHGRVVRDGVYYVVVKAQGADGIEYNIRRDVNVLTGTKGDNSNGTSAE